MPPTPLRHAALILHGPIVMLAMAAGATAAAPGIAIKPDGQGRFEDIDGWLTAPGEHATMAGEDSAGFVVRRAEGDARRWPPSLACFVGTDGPAEAAMARITVQADREASRRMSVRWRGQPIGTFDTASYLDERRTFWLALPGPHVDGPAERQIRRRRPCDGT
jgi:hypothetical protein